MGQGPRTGRGAGYCSGYEAPGYANPGPGWGRGRGGWGRGRGYGRGWGFRRGWAYGPGPGWGPPPAWGYGPYPAPPAPEQEVEMLRAQAQGLRDQLDAIQQRLEELESKG